MGWLQAVVGGVNLKPAVSNAALQIDNGWCSDIPVIPLSLAWVASPGVTVFATAGSISSSTAPVGTWFTHRHYCSSTSPTRLEALSSDHTRNTLAQVPVDNWPRAGGVLVLLQAHPETK